ncbi:MAG: hypothetical protein ABEI52_08565 [Halobacteriaceae archaeon]
MWLVFIMWTGVAATGLLVGTMKSARRRNPPREPFAETLNAAGRALDCATMTDGVMRSAPKCGALLLPQLKTSRPFCVDGKCLAADDVARLRQLTTRFAEEQSRLEEEMEAANRAVLERIDSFSDAQRGAFEQLNVRMDDRYRALDRSRREAVDQLESIMASRYEELRSASQVGFDGLRTALQSGQEESNEQRREQLQRVVSQLDEHYAAEAEERRRKFSELNKKLTELQN